MHPKIKKSIFLIGFALVAALAARYFLNDLVTQLNPPNAENGHQPEE